MSYRRKSWTRSPGCELAASGRAGCRAWIGAARALSRRCVRRARPVRAARDVPRSVAVQSLDRVHTSLAETNEQGYAAGHRDARQRKLPLVNDAQAAVVRLSPYPGRHRKPVDGDGPGARSLLGLSDMTPAGNGPEQELSVSRLAGRHD